VRLLRRELEARSAQLKKLPKEARPDGKVTRELAGKRSLRLRPIVCVIDECQNLFTHPVHGKDAADDAAYVIRLGRAYGIILVLATQRPDKESLPTAISGNVTARFCLRVPGHMENDLILGTSAHQNGYRATVFRAKTDAGMGWLKGDGDPQVVRTYYLDLPDAERIAARARIMREQAGVLSGYALGEDSTEPARCFAADVLTVFGTDAKLYSETIAARLRERIPAAYATITADAVASQLRALGVTVKDVREPGGPVRKGCERAAVETVAEAADV
jgi:S-DNA-T family DNA segregation ATPase FtsK/SpoIIIE